MVKTKKAKIINKELSFTDFPLIRNIFSKFSKIEEVWDDTDEKGELKNPQTLKFENHTTFIFDNEKESVTLSYDENSIPKLILKKITGVLRTQEELLTKEEFLNIPMFKNCDTGNNIIQGEKGLLKRKTIAFKLADEVSKLGFKEFKFTDYSRKNEMVSDELQLCLDCSGSDGIMDKDLKLLIKDDIYFYTNEYDLPYSTHTYIKWQINGESKNVGIYIPKRNIVVLFFNPLFPKCFSDIDWEDNEGFLKVFDKIKESIKGLKIKKHDNTEERERITIDIFLKELQNNKTKLENDRKMYMRYIEESQDKLMLNHRKKKEIEIQLEALMKGRDGLAESIAKELSSIRKLKIVNKVGLKDGKIEVEFIPSNIVVPNFQLSTSSKKFGKREIYIGRMIAQISPTSIHWDNVDIYDVEGTKYVHPHVNSRRGHGCYGDGDGNSLIFELLGAGKYTDLIRYLWIWIKVCRDGKGYSRSELYYNENLKRGFPVWDEKGNRIVINDPARIESGEQMKLTPYKDMEKTLETFKNYKR